MKKSSFEIFSSKILEDAVERLRSDYNFVIGNPSSLTHDGHAYHVVTSGRGIEPPHNGETRVIHLSEIEAVQSWERHMNEYLSGKSKTIIWRVLPEIGCGDMFDRNGNIVTNYDVYSRLHADAANN